MREIYDFISDDATQSNTDRAAALIVGSILEESLEAAICRKLDGWKALKEGDKDKHRDLLFGYGGNELAPLHSFSARARVGFALGIFNNNTLDDLDTIKNIRNLFVHFKGPATFDVDEIAFLCNELKLLQDVDFDRPLIFRGSPKTPKEKFMRVSQIVTLYLLTTLDIYQNIKTV